LRVGEKKVNEQKSFLKGKTLHPITFYHLESSEGHHVNLICILKYEFKYELFLCFLLPLKFNLLQKRNGTSKIFGTVELFITGQFSETFGVWSSVDKKTNR
jgi:hypothetical protein